MFANCLIKLINNHLILMDNGQNILIDTGSPVSIHPSGTLVIGENEFSVQSNVPCVSPQYISEKVRYEIHGYHQSHANFFRPYKGSDAFG